VKWFVGALAAALLLLQYRVWFSSDGVSEVWRLRTAVAAQQSDNERLSARNRQLAAEVRDLKQGYSALEERARSDLGMVATNETFFQVGPAEAPVIAPSVPAATAPPSQPLRRAPAPGTPPARTAAVR
jgi:cell division protein FtsB